MQKLKTFSRLLCGLLVSLAGGTAQAQRISQPETNPGWAIVLAADYKGGSSPLYPVVQYDAMHWYRLLITKFHFAPDHIVLLAEGKPDSDFGNFLDKKTLPLGMALQSEFRDSKVWAEYAANKNRVRRQLDNLKTVASGQAVKDTADDFRDLFTTSGSIPIAEEPTAQNFRTARSIISRLATKDDMLCVFVSTHAGIDPNLVMTKPAGAIAPGNIAIRDADFLRDQDFSFTECKAQRRLLIMDESLRYFNEEVKTTEGLYCKRNAMIESVFAGNGNEQSLVLMSNNGNGISWPLATEGDNANAPEISGGAFTGSAIAQIEQGMNGSVGSWLEKFQRRFNVRMAVMSRAKRLFDPLPVGYRKPETLTSCAEALKKTRLQDFLALPSETELNRQPEIIGSNDLSTSEPAPLNPELRLLKIKSVIIGQFSKDRIGVIRNRFVRAIHSGLTNRDLLQIQAGVAPNGEPVVLMPAKAYVPQAEIRLAMRDLAMQRTLLKKSNLSAREKLAAKERLLKDSEILAEANTRWFVAADVEFARLKGVPKHELADQIASDIREALTVKHNRWLCYTANPVAEFFSGIAFYKQNEFNDAINKFKSAIRLRPDYFEAYIWLSRSLNQSGQKERAQEVAKALRGVFEDYPEYGRANPETVRELAELKGQIAGN